MISSEGASFSASAISRRRLTWKPTGQHSTGRVVGRVARETDHGVTGGQRALVADRTSSSVSFSPGRRPVKMTKMSSLVPCSSMIILWARSTICTGDPISRMKGPWAPSAGERLVRVERPRLEHQLDRLLDGHEVALHPGMGDRHRTAGFDLLLEERQHAAPAAQHVAEAHAAEAGRRVRACDDSCIRYSPTRFVAPMTELGSTALSVEMLTISSHPVASGRLGDHHRAADVVDHGLVGAEFHERARA